jgi:hypothetical protein
MGSESLTAAIRRELVIWVRFTQTTENCSAFHAHYFGFQGGAAGALSCMADVITGPWSLARKRHQPQAT